MAQGPSAGAHPQRAAGPDRGPGRVAPRRGDPARPGRRGAPPRPARLRWVAGPRPRPHSPAGSGDSATRITMNSTEIIDRDSLRDDIPDFRPGDTVKVHVRVVEGTRERVQIFQGAVIRRQGGGVQETFTVRKVSFGVGVERTFPVHSPSIAKLEVVSLGDVRRAKLYYLRERHGKSAKIKERRTVRP